MIGSMRLLNFQTRNPPAIKDTIAKIE